MGVSLSDTPMAGFERHSFRCSACAHIARRLVLSRPRSPITNLPLVVQHPKPPAARLPIRRVAVPSSSGELAEKFRRRRRAAENPAEAFNWEEAFANLRSEDTPIQDRPGTVRSSSTFKPVEKPPARPPMLRGQPNAELRHGLKQSRRFASDRAHSKSAQQQKEALRCQVALGGREPQQEMRTPKRPRSHHRKLGRKPLKSFVAH